MEEYKRRVLKKGKTEKDRILFDMRNAFNEIKNRVPNLHDVIINNETYSVILEDRRFLDEELHQKYMITPYDFEVFKVGDYVKALGKYWFIELIEEENVESNRAYRLMPCNQTLKWQDKDGRIYEFPCHAVDKTSVYSDGLSRSRWITTSTYQLQVIVPKNKHTLKLNSSDRFIFEHSKYHVYTITRIDIITREGLMTIVMKRDEYTKEYDDLEQNLSVPIGTNSALDENIIKPENPDGEIKYETLEIIGEPKITVRQKDIEYVIPFGNTIVWQADSEYFKDIRFEGKALYVTPKKIGNTIIKATVDGQEIEKTVQIGFMW